ncbi:hypothetical protein [Geoalkalibacter halelectricus]|uniref:Uncharacterized protein n=1 Tax=Geoalkalibacter halelectricus TaxID=2847045 RepID=A0ABY5ZJB2_9BACT|nr:hypothetical protein [Geoalkalibacter halelectricus]MDO3378281.1 hypothetical protein [Geoalkalibacter halelectricus]UWZ79128.1 hypothetical protein L9S41_15800 [Geoalkalibacter halelectricus]
MQTSDPAVTRGLYLLAILFILIGFGVEIYAVTVNSWAVFRIGLGIFLLSIPCAALGWYLRHRDAIRARH